MNGVIDLTQVIDGSVQKVGTMKFEVDNEKAFFDVNTSFISNVMDKFIPCSNGRTNYIHLVHQNAIASKVDVMANNSQKIEKMKKWHLGTIIQKSIYQESANLASELIALLELKINDFYGFSSELRYLLSYFLERAVARQCYKQLVQDALENSVTWAKIKATCNVEWSEADLLCVFYSRICKTLRGIIDSNKLEFPKGYFSLNLNNEEILDRLLKAYDSVPEGNTLPGGFVTLIKDLATLLGRVHELHQRDESHAIKDFSTPEGENEGGLSL